MNDNDLFHKLAEALETELKVYQHLTDVCRQEKEALIAVHNEEIRKTAHAKEALFQKIHQIDAERDLLARELCRQLGLKPEPPRLKELVQKAQGTLGARLTALQTGLELEIQKIQELNTMNGRLIEAALENVRGALGSIRGTLAEKPVYKKEGRVETKTLSGQFVSREA